MRQCKASFDSPWDCEVDEEDAEEEFPLCVRIGAEVQAMLWGARCPASWSGGSYEREGVGGASDEE